MIFERRAVIFPRADFLDALRRFAGGQDKVLPNTPPDHLHFEPSQKDVTLTITFPALPGGVMTRFVFSYEDVMQALLAYCRNYKVPLPKAATKAVEKYKDGVVLSIQLGEPALNVMIIDNQKVARAMMRKSLSKVNPTVIEADTGTDALHLLRNGGADPDVILCTGTMDWNDFVRQLRGDTKNRNCRKPVLILTGNKSEAAHATSLHLGASKVLLKPVAPDELIKQIMLARGYFEVRKAPAHEPWHGLG